jgi:quercetin dioxygenase-like cupin family protein
MRSMSGPTPTPRSLEGPDQDHGNPTSTSSTTKFPPGASTGWHSHPGSSLILVVSGTVTHYSGDDPSCAPHAYPAGDGFIYRGSVHMLQNESSDPAETIAVQLLPKDAAEGCCSTGPR